MEASVDYTALKFNLDLPSVMSFRLVPHLPRFGAWELRTTVANKQTDRNYANLYIFSEFSILIYYNNTTYITCNYVALQLVVHYNIKFRDF